MTEKQDLNEPQFYIDSDTDLETIRERLLDSLLNLPETCFFRRTPKIVSEIKMFGSDETIHVATYRYTPMEPISLEVMSYGK
jgi:hypothetical protein